MINKVFSSSVFQNQPSKWKNTINIFFNQSTLSIQSGYLLNPNKFDKKCHLKKKGEQLNKEKKIFKF